MVGPAMLNKEHLSLINSSLRRLHDLQPAMDKCRNCGLDVSAQEDDRRFLVEQLESIKREFFAKGRE